MKNKLSLKNRLKGLGFILPIITIVFYAYFWVITTINNELTKLGTSPEFNLIMIIVFFIIIKERILDKILKWANNITKEIAEGKGLHEQFDELIPKEPTENTY